MPELPEVETIKSRLSEIIIGQRIQSIEVLRTKSFQGNQTALIGATITAVERRAKVLSLELSSGYSVLVHLKMTGQIIVVTDQVRIGGGHPTADWVRDLPSPHTRVIIRFQAPNAALFFNDQRVFGWMKVVNQKQKQQELSCYGPDINSDDLSPDFFWSGLQRSRQPIKVRIMDGSFVAGVGNIYACDALNLAGISPFRPCNTLTRLETEKLLMATVTVIKKGIALRGTTFDGAYVGVDGFAGSYQTEVLVYGRKDQPCKQCGALIQKEKLAGRGTFFCPACQL
jgi:formamidopyrimidine-DNA glycosylase